MELNTSVLECMYCKRLFVVPTEMWEMGEEINCICGIWNGTVKIGRFKRIHNIILKNGVF